jgi:hypothetical protein
MQLAGFYDSCGQVRPLLLKSCVFYSYSCVVSGRSSLRVGNLPHTVQHLHMIKVSPTLPTQLPYYCASSRLKSTSTATTRRPSGPCGRR